MKRAALVILAAAAVAALLQAQPAPQSARAREIFEELIGINTTDTPAGNVTRAA